MFADFLGRDLCPGDQHGREQAHQHVHNDRCNSSGNHKCGYGNAHDLTGALAAFHVGYGTGNGGKHHRNHYAEHHVDEHGSHGLENGGAGAGDDTAAHVHVGGPQPADKAPQYHGGQHNAQEQVVFCNGFFVEFFTHV